MLRWLISGDLQIHAWKQFSHTRKDGMNSRLWNCLHVFDVLLKEAQKRGITKILINGDLFEENSYIDIEVFDATCRKIQMLHKAGMEICINMGNHDVSRQSGRHVLHSLGAFRPIAKIVEEPTLVWQHIFVVPWSPSADKIKEAIKSCRATKETSLVGHFGVYGAKTGPKGYIPKNAITVMDLKADKFGLVLLSDYHTRQRLADNVYYLGSPLQHSFGEIHRPCIWSVSLDREKVFTTERVYTSFPQFRNWDSDASLSRFRKDTAGWHGDYVRVRPHAGLPEQAIKRTAREIGFHVQIVSGKEDNVPSAVRMGDEYNLRRTFRQYVRREIAGRERQERLLKLGNKLYRGEM
jgi:DNA repair exonuclease SbcCD nuclease subunit